MSDQSAQELAASRALDRIGRALIEQGLTLEALIESGRELRGELIEAQYGIAARDEASAGNM